MARKKQVRVNDTEVQLLHLQDKVTKLEQQVVDMSHRLALMQSNGQSCYKKVDTMSMNFACFYQEHVRKLKFMEHQYNKTLRVVKSMHHKLYDPIDTQHMFDVFFDDGELDQIIQTDFLDDHETNCEEKA
jgi:hypothetical protein